ncbi:MAG: AraC family transcriptional regulator [Cyanobacteria bacterium P01_C01_bin.118]
MTTQPRLNHVFDCLLPGSPSDPRLLHSDPSDRVFFYASDLGQGYRQEIPLRDDITLMMIDYTPNQDLLFDMVGDGNRIEFEFHLAGPHEGYSLYIPCFRLRQFGVRRANKQVFKVEVIFRRPALIKYAQLFMERLSPKANAAAKNILQLIYRRQIGGIGRSTAEVVNQIFAPVATEPATGLSMEHILTDALYEESAALSYAMRCAITPAMQRLIEQILSCPYQGMTRRAYLTHRALKLVDLRLNALLQPPLNDADMRCTSQAAALLRTQLNQPPSLETLARQVGTNRLTLTQGFHKLYGTTPFGYLRDCRVYQARRLLVTSELSVTQIASAVGYTSRSRFATAFRKKTGINPKAFQLQAWQNAR